MTSLPGSSQGADRRTPIHIQARSERFLQDIVDAHVHLSERRDDALIRFARTNGLRYSLDELLRTMRRHKIMCGLLLSPHLQGGSALQYEQIIKLCDRCRGTHVPTNTV